MADPIVVGIATRLVYSWFKYKLQVLSFDKTFIYSVNPLVQNITLKERAEKYPIACKVWIQNN